jgi:hypothetical protein
VKYLEANNIRHILKYVGNSYSGMESKIYKLWYIFMRQGKLKTNELIEGKICQIYYIKEEIDFNEKHMR